MKASEEFQAILSDYREDLILLDNSLRPGDGVFGFGRVPGDDPCHARFDARAADLAESWAQPDKERDGAAELVRAMLCCDRELSLPVYAQGMLVAIQRHVLPLIPRLTGAEAGEIRSWYEKQYPFYRRMPVQKDVLRALKSAETRS